MTLSRCAEQPCVDRVRQAAQALPPLAFEPVAGAGAAVVVRVVQRRDDVAVGADDGGGLEVVGGDPLSLHREDRLCHVAEAAAGEGAGDIEAADSLVKHPVAGKDVGGSVAVGQIPRVEARRRKPYLLVTHRREAELVEHRLDRPCTALPHFQRVLLGERLDPGVNLPVALQGQPLVEVVRVVVAAAEHVVAPRHDRVAEVTKSVPGRNCPISFAVLRISEWLAIASFPEATSRSSHAASTFSASTSRVPPGTESASATHEIDPF